MLALSFLDILHAFSLVFLLGVQDNTVFDILACFLSVFLPVLP
jgi:hypothetical protein